jgi:hypothetical protein
MMNQQRKIINGNSHRNFCLLLTAALVFFSISSCNKDHSLDFTKSWGDEMTETRDVTGNFTRIRLENDIDLSITQGDSYSITVTGGENILSGIITEISDSSLIIRNENRYNWVRSYDNKLIVYVTLPHLFQLNYESTGTVTCTDTICEDSLFIDSHGGSGYINMLVNTGLAHMSIHRGSADIKAVGYCGSNFIYSASYGVFHCEDLETINTYMLSKGTGNCYIRVLETFEYLLEGKGNIYYWGRPVDVRGTDTGIGELVPME